MNNPEERMIWTATFAIMTFGLVALYSASYENVRVTQQVFFDQLFFCLFVLGIMFILSRISYRAFYGIAYFFYGASALLLIGVLIFGHSALGATRWVYVAGLKFQPSEISKFALILFLARYFGTRHPRLSFDAKSMWGAFWHDMAFPLFLTLVTCVLVFKQPDLGTAILLFLIFLGMLYVSGVDSKLFWVLTGGCFVLVPLGLRFLKPYQLDRILVFLNPNIDPLGAGYTVIQSRIAVGSGQLWGKGWLSGTQNQLNFLPERHTDFIFSVIGEEWGFAGSLLLIGLCFYLCYAGIRVAMRVKDQFGRLLAVGIVTIWTMQVVINTGMTMGVCPVVGITLPLVSYGRTSMLSFAVMLGVLLSISRRRSA